MLRPALVIQVGEGKDRKLVPEGWCGCMVPCPMCNHVCGGVDDHEPPFHGCDICGYVWHVKGYERIPIPEKWDDRDLRQQELFDFGGYPRQYMRPIEIKVIEVPKKVSRKFLELE